ncbi:hypothetical protein [Streptomyces sp. x-80]
MPGTSGQRCKLSPQSREKLADYGYGYERGPIRLGSQAGERRVGMYERP